MQVKETPKTIEVPVIIRSTWGYPISFIRQWLKDNIESVPQAKYTQVLSLEKEHVQAVSPVIAGADIISFSDDLKTALIQYRPTRTPSYNLVVLKPNALLLKLATRPMLPCALTTRLDACNSSLQPTLLSEVDLTSLQEVESNQPNLMAIGAEISFCTLRNGEATPPQNGIKVIPLSYLDELPNSQRVLARFREYIVDNVIFGYWVTKGLLYEAISIGDRDTLLSPDFVIESVSKDLSTANVSSEALSFEGPKDKHVALMYCGLTDIFYAYVESRPPNYEKHQQAYKEQQSQLREHMKSLEAKAD